MPAPPPALHHRDFRLFWGGAVLSALTGGIGALLVVLGVALVPGVRAFTLGDESRRSLA